MWESGRFSSLDSRFMLQKQWVPSQDRRAPRTASFRSEASPGADLREAIHRPTSLRSRVALASALS